MNALVTIPEYSQTAIALAELEGRLKSVVYDVTTGKGMDVAKKDRAEVRDLRVALEKERVRIKAPALERSRLIDAEAKSLTAKLVDLEAPIDAQIKAEEQKKERAKEAAEQAERERVAAIQRRFDAIKGRPTRGIGKGVIEVEALIAEAEAEDIATGFDPTLLAAAAFESRMALSALKSLRDGAILAEQAEAKAAAERAELDALRAKVAEQERQEAAEARRVEQERQQAENTARAEREAAEAAERAALNKQLQEQAQKAADERAAAERARKEAEAAAEEAAIKNASLAEAATEALALLDSIGQGKHVAARKLRAALGLK